MAVAVAGSGGLDPTFGESGTTVVERPTSTYPTPVGLTAAGKIVAVTTEGGVITVSRFLANGAPDPTFDGDGTATIEEPETFPSAHAAAVQPDGKIILVGFKNLPGKRSGRDRLAPEGRWWLGRRQRCARSRASAPRGASRSSLTR